MLPVTLIIKKKEKRKKKKKKAYMYVLTEIILYHFYN